MNQHSMPQRPYTLHRVWRGLIALAMVASMLAAFAPDSRLATAQAEEGLASYAPAGALVYGEVELDPASDQAVLALELLERANLEALLTADQQDELDEGLAVAEDLLAGQAAFFFGPIAPGELDADEVSSEASKIANDPLAATQDLPSGWALVLAPNEPQALYDLLLDSLEAPIADSAAVPALGLDATPEASAAGPEVESETYDGYEIFFVPATEDTDGRALALVEEIVVAASTADDVKTVIDVATGSTTPLADDENFQAVRAELPDQTLAAGYLNGPAWLELIEAQDAAELEQIPSDLLDSFAVHQGFAVWADQPGFRMDAVAIPADGAQPAEAATDYEPAFTGIVPDSAIGFAGGMDLGRHRSLEALALLFAQGIVGTDTGAMATPIDPEANADQVFADAEELIGFNLKTDVLDQLAGEWAVAGTTDLASGSAIFVSEIVDPSVVQDVTAEITALLASEPDAAYEITSRDVNGSEVTVVEITDTAVPVTIEYGVVDGYLVVGLNGWLDLVTTPATDPLADDQTFQDTFAVLPTDITSLSYLNVQALLPLIDVALGEYVSPGTGDANPACAEYVSQEEAQAAFDEDPFGNYMLDLDGDGEACEDSFGAATPVGTPSGIAEINVLSFGAVTWVEEGVSGSSAIIFVGE